MTYKGRDKPNVRHAYGPVVDINLVFCTVGTDGKTVLDTVQVTRREETANRFGTRSQTRHFAKVTRAGRGDTTT
jgi:hypothetical protein